MDDELTFYCRLTDRAWVVTGELSRATPSWLNWPVAMADTVLDLSDLEVSDGAGVLAAVNGVRVLRANATSLTLIGTPQLLAHTLYRVGALDAEPGLRLVGTREEEPYG